MRGYSIGKSMILAAALVYLNLCGSLAFAEEDPKEDIVVEGKTYHKAHVVGMDGDKVVTLHSADGEFQWPYENLTPLLQQDARAKIHPNITGKVIGLVQGGVLISNFETHQVVFLYHHPLLSQMVEGDRVSCLGRAGGTYHYTNAEGTASTIRAFEYFELKFD